MKIRKKGFFAFVITISRWMDEIILAKKISKEIDYQGGKSMRIEYEFRCEASSREKEILEEGVDDNCTRGVEVIGEAGRVLGLIFIEVVADLLEHLEEIVKLLLTGNSKLVFPPAPLPRLPSVQ